MLGRVGQTPVPGPETQQPTPDVSMIPETGASASHKRTDLSMFTYPKADWSGAVLFIRPRRALKRLQGWSLTSEVTPSGCIYVTIVKNTPKSTELPVLWQEGPLFVAHTAYFRLGDVRSHRGILASSPTFCPRRYWTVPECAVLPLIGTHGPRAG